MGLVEDFERRLENIVEGFFAKAFRSRVEPAEIGRRLLREQEGGKSVSVDAVYVPNRYEVRLSKEDHDRLEGLLGTLADQFCGLLNSSARERRWRFPGGVEVVFVAGNDLASGRFSVTAFHSAATPVTREPQAGRLRVAGGDLEGSWVLDNGELIIGRNEACDVILTDPDVSRRHARLERREDGWWLVDLDSTNHTYINGHLVKERRLSPGDRVRIGETELIYDQAS